MKKTANKVSKHRVQAVKEKVFNAIVPSYLLDEAYQFVEWNRAFELMIAEPLGLSLKMHAAEFVERCENRREVLERSAKVFAVGRTPKSDHEKLIVRTQEFGLMELHKLATAIRNPESDEVMWIVSLDIVSADHLDRVFDRVMKISEEMAST